MQDIQCDKSVLTTLQAATKEEVDFLVDLITKDGAGRMALSSSVKTLLTAEKASSAYSDYALRLLTEEFQRYGGHSLVNVFRTAFLGYDVILRDVHGKLNGKDSKTKRETALEEEIVLGLFGPGWLRLDPIERRSRSTDTKVLTGLFNLPDKSAVSGKAVSRGLAGVASLLPLALSRLATGPAAGAAVALTALNHSVSEAYRITIPFVAQVAWIRMRMRTRA